MEKAFDLINENFLLENSVAKDLFHGIVKSLPLIDYHCHIDPLSLQNDYRFSDIAELWVLNDPYKHRAMRINGIPEQEITGIADRKTKFQRWIETLDKCIGNPLFHWSYLELKRFFDWKTCVSPEEWEVLWDHLNSRVDASTTGSLLAPLKVEQIVTSDTLGANLEVHKRVNEKNLGAYRIRPSLRGDEILDIEQRGFINFLHNLQQWYRHEIKDLSSYFQAITNRLEEFHASGCRIADHSLDSFTFLAVEEAEAERLFLSVLKGIQLSEQETIALKSFLLLKAVQLYSEKDWILSLHLGAQRFTSQRLRNLVGPAGGYACINNSISVPSLVRFLDFLERRGNLPRTILFPLNPSDYPVIATITGSFSEDRIPGKIQFGPAWWYNDHKWGIQLHLNTLSSYSLLEHFIGMTTDSRSILSLTRHEYFRRIFCSFLGRLVETGEAPRNDTVLERIARSVCYENAKNWLN